MGTRILLIEDEDVVRKIVERMLVRAGYGVSCAKDGSVGLELFNRVRPDLVVTDIIMPEKEGIEVIRYVRRHAPSTRIIAMSGGGILRTMDVLSYALKLGADFALRKPFQLDELLGAVRTALEPTGLRQ